MAITLKKGDKAPDFTGIDQDGNKFSLKENKGRKIALYFYPQDLTATCTVQACNLRDHHQDLQVAGITIIGVSPDDAAKHQRFISKNKLPFTLIADTNLKICKKYGVWEEKQMFGHKYMGVLRTTFIIDEKGKIIEVITRPRSKQHAAEILAAIENGG